MSNGAAEESGNVSTELNRDIGLLGAVAIGVGTMIAAGIFVLSGLAVSKVGAVAILSFVIAAVVASFTAAAYAEFSSIYPESGGGYMYVANTFQQNFTYLMGWTMILGYPASAAFYLASFSDWFYRFMYPVFNIPHAIPYWIPGVVVLALLVAINISGSEESSQFQIVVTALKVALIGLFLYGGFQAFDASVAADSVARNINQFAQIGVTSALVFITFFGFSAIATNAEEVKRPGWTIPRAIYISMGFVTIVYALVVLVIVFAVNNQQFLDFLAGSVSLEGLAPTQFIAENGEVSMAYAAQYYLGGIGFYVIIVGALLSMLSAANATILAGSRVKLAMARRDHLPARFEELHPDYETPYNTVLLTGGLILTFMLLFTVVFGKNPEVPLSEASFPLGIHLGIEATANFANFLLILGLSTVNVSLVRSRKKYPDQDRQFTVPLVPWVPYVGVLANLALLVNLGARIVIIGLIAEAIGILFWLAWKRRGASTEQLEEETPTVVTRSTPAESDYRILVPIANPENVDQLLRTAADIAADRGGEVLAMSTVTIPEQTPLSRGHEYIDEEREILRRTTAIADGGTTDTDRGNLDVDTKANAATDTENLHGSLDVHDVEVPVSATIRISHHVDTAILNTIEQYDADAVLMGWGARGSRRREIVFGSVVDTVATEADCDVLVERLGPDATGEVDSVLLPTAGGTHAELTEEICRAVCRATGAHAEVLRVVSPGDRKDEDEEAMVDARERVEETTERLREAGIEVETTVAESDDVLEAIAGRSGEHDLTVIGATRTGILQQLVFGAIPEEVAREADSTVLVAKRNEGLSSQALQSLRRWIS